MQTKRVPNVFMSLYRLARQEDFDSLKWRNILTGIHRKSNEKHSIKDICLLYYSLFKANSTTYLSNLKITYKDPETKENLGPLTIRDIADVYINKVSDLLCYMNTKQLAIISKYLHMMNRLNESFCNTILSRISSNSLKITSRSFFNILLTLSESKYVNSDSIERLIIQNKGLLLDMNSLDLQYLLKSIAIHNITNETILNIVSDKLEYYLRDMKPDGILSTLNYIYRLDWYNESVFMNLYFRIQSLLPQYKLSSITLISKCLSHFKPRGIEDFFDSQLIPTLHNISDADAGNLQLSDKVDILLLYNNCYKCGSRSFPKLLPQMLNSLTEDYQWDLLFSALNLFKTNSNVVEPDLIEDQEDFGSLLAKSIEFFKLFLNANEVVPKYLSSISKNVVELGVEDEDLFLQILKKMKDHDNFPIDSLIDVLFNLHTVENDHFNIVYDQCLQKLLDHERVLDYSFSLRILSILFYRDISPGPGLLSIFKSLFDIKNLQDSSWKISTSETFRSLHKISRFFISDDNLEYLLYSIVFPSCVSGSGPRLSQYLPEVSCIFKMIPEFKKNELLNALLYYIGKFDKNLLNSLLESRKISCTPLKIDNLPVNLVPKQLLRFEKVEYLLLKFDEDVFGPFYLISGTRDVYYYGKSKEKWDSITMNIYRHILTSIDYNPIKI
ncbi:hypothetical protein TpMuguga_01g00579 [Theileria parva strain Muguga]|uniref:RAP domain-containing protein n=1 Tax=Theileria parva TaxID=5875 RepID=Q4N891_THEPA|nr:uncharacterized protein TpMuguga_01g00579 [Theileria parva strain Muguga]EAN33817.1 hypothetical protein TpMuguga_01g00579 [Theileria parva strain Muguga]|eukprot:XP_766100.1 hypothetical protein [Theileria parva strain Muguga]